MKASMLCGLVLVAGSSFAWAQDGFVTEPNSGERYQVNPLPPAQPAGAPRIDAVFVLDTTGSMSSLIEAAKLKIWSIANTMVTGKPRPDIRMGLLAYRDRGDAYVTKPTAPTDDLDKVYADLMGFTAEGGGDEPESVNQALSEAVNGFSWDMGEGTLRIVYLVGDAPPHMDYEQDAKYDATCKAAAERGIIINTIRCGGIAAAEPIWQDIARRAEGEYFHIDNEGAAVAIATPYDAELNALSLELDRTLIPYGDASAQRELSDKVAASGEIAAAAAAPAAAERAEYKSSDAGLRTLVGRQELVQDCKDGKVDVAALKDEELPEAMRAMTAEERRAHVQTQAAAREGISSQMGELATKRQEYIRQEMAKLGAGVGTFDALVFKCLKAQAARKGIVYEEAR